MAEATKPKLLIVDDEPDALLILAKTLLARGYNVMTAESGLQAINLVKMGKPDLILLDILMPGMDGTQVAAALQEDPTTQNIPVIFLTCLVTKETQEIGEKYHGAVRYSFMSKPYNLDDLLTEIERLIGARVQ
jgi:sigma-B regulation protein RsbU (phosphoserine phosphatase)